MAGVGSGVFPSCQEGVETMVKLERTFEPDLSQHHLYEERFRQYRQLYPIAKQYLKDVHRTRHLQ